PLHHQQASSTLVGPMSANLRLARLLHAVMDKKRMMRPAAMHYLAIATDGDGTLMRGGRFGRRTVAALRRWRAAGRKLLLVTGETPKELCEFPHRDLFDLLVAENGGLVVHCDLRKERPLVDSPPADLRRALKRA